MRKKKSTGHLKGSSGPASSMPFSNEVKGLNKYSYTVDIVHRKNKNIKRLREMNRQYRIKPWKGLKEILMKKEGLNIDDCDSVHSEDYKDFAEMIR